jgi:excisionase family DNA binding protein
MRPVLPPDLKPYSFLTLEEAAGLLNVKLRWMRDAVEDGRIAHYKIGRLVRIQAADLVAYVAACRVDSSARTSSGTVARRSGRAPQSATAAAAETSRPAISGSRPAHPGTVVSIRETRPARTRQVG